MTTAAEVRRMLRPLLARNPDLVLVGRRLVMPPVRHIVRGVLIGRTSSASHFKPMWMASPLFEPHGFDHLWPGEWIFPDCVSWLVREPAAAAQLERMLEGEILPMLRRMDSLEAFLAHDAGPGFPRGELAGWPLRYVWIDAAMGNLDAVLECCEDVDVQLKKPLRPGEIWARDYSREKTELLGRLWPLARTRDRAGVAALLRGYEEEAVTRLKLLPYWEPAPYPIACAGSSSPR